MKGKNTKKVLVQLARLVRETAYVVVEYDGDDPDLREVYEAAEMETDGHWHPDYEWGAEEGTHEILEENPGGNEYPTVRLPREG